MRLLVLSVDRDDDLGRKTGIRAPIVGREALLHAATALAVADPEEADANGMFAAIKEYDEISQRKLEYGADEVHVAAVTGHIREGLLADNVIAQQVDEILRETRAEAVILVSDGAEDEHILPILKTRVKVNGIRRVVVKQARNLEGALFLFSRLLHDEKLQKRFFLPLAVLLIAAGAAILFKRWEILGASALFLVATYILYEVFSLQEPLGALVRRLGNQMRAGKLSLFSALAAFGLVVWGGVRTLAMVAGVDRSDRIAYTLQFTYHIFWWIVAALCLSILGRGLDRYVRERLVLGRYWESAIFILAGASLAWAALGFLVSPQRQLNLEFATWILFGGFFFFTGLIAHRYFAQMNHPPTTSPK